MNGRNAHEPTSTKKERTPKPGDFKPDPHFPKGHRHEGKRRCQAWSPTRGRQCMGLAVTGRNVCGRCGGATPTGFALPQTKHGRFSKSLPARLMASYEAALEDPTLLSTRGDIAVLVARQEDLLQRVDSGEAGLLWRQAREEWKEFKTALAAGDQPTSRAAMAQLDELLGRGAADYAAWHELARVTEQIRKLRETERKLLEAHQATMTAEQLGLLIGALTHAVRSHVRDARVLDAIGRDIERLVAQPRSA